MHALTPRELSAEAARFDAAALATPEIDSFCSALAWSLSAHEAFAPQRELVLRRADAGYIALALAHDLDGTRVLQPLEAIWGLGSPVVGAPVDSVVAELRAELDADEGWDVALLCGIREGSALWGAYLSHLGRRYRLLRGPVTRRYVASLEGGVDAFLARRSRNLRKSLRKSAERARQLGIVVESAATESPTRIMERLLALEARSWKGLEGTGINTPEMAAFYAAMVPRLAQEGRLRLLIAKRGERDVGFILGGCLGDTYRGLQFSFDAELASVGLGNWLQLEQISRLCDEGVLHYDLGTDVEYKRRWGERVVDTLTVFVTR